MRLASIPTRLIGALVIALAILAAPAGPAAAVAQERTSPGADTASTVNATQESGRDRAGAGRRRGLRSPPAGHVARGAVEVHYWPGGEALAEAILEPTGVLAELPGLPADALETGSPIRVYLAPDAARFNELTGGRAPEWGAGVAIPDAGVVVLPGYNSARAATGRLPRILRHELAHVALHRHVAPSRVPRWFSEGYATWAAGQLDPEAGWMLRLAFLAGSAPPLDSLTIRWPAGQIDARIAYLLSASVIQYLHERGGDRVLGIFLDRWKETGAFEPSLRSVYGLSMGQLERHWSRDVRKRYGWLVFLAQTTVIWAIVAALVIALSAARLRRNRQRMERLREQDRREAELLEALYRASIEPGPESSRG